MKKLKLILKLLATPAAAFLGAVAVGRIYVSETIDDYKETKK